MHQGELQHNLPQLYPKGFLIHHQQRQPSNMKSLGMTQKQNDEQVELMTLPAACG
jgi:hypothetical protein